MLNSEMNMQYSLFPGNDKVANAPLLSSKGVGDAIFDCIKIDSLNGGIETENIGQRYEAALAKADKVQKKRHGQYYTPSDVARVMSEWLDGIDGSNVCDVACGTGNLILAYLDYIGQDRAIKLVKSGRLYLYDADGTALDICLRIIAKKYGVDCESVTAIEADFLSAKVSLPKDSKVISNPPYCAVQSVGEEWDNTEVLRETRELYALFMEKIIKQSVSSVIITPYSFISSDKFSSVRRVMTGKSGMIFAFDNIPGNIFCGQKQGIFNTNMMNSVRSAITVTDGTSEAGYRVTPLIRFRRSERERLLRCDVLESFLGSRRQVISAQNTQFVKCFKSLEPIYDAWRAFANGHTFGEIAHNEGTYALYVPNTCRYFTSASTVLLHRGGQAALYFDDEQSMDYAYCVLNSSFAYWWWRLFDGGITYTKGLLLKMPSLFHALSDDDKGFFHSMKEEMAAMAGNFKVTKNNVGVQENIKFPRKYRDRINNRLLCIIGIADVNSSVFDAVHSNAALEVSIMKQKIPLARAQREIMGEFYVIKPTRVIFDKQERKDLWDKATKHKDIDFDKIKKVCPALAHQIERSNDSSDNIQSAVFSECVYAQTLANMFGLKVFVNCFEDAHFVPDNVVSLLHSYNLVARYTYSTRDKRRMLIEAGGCGGIDSALITVIDLKVYTIEFKEPYAKTSEPDLPKYSETGDLLVTNEFITSNPQFRLMLEEQKGLNLFDNMGHNINNFTTESIQCAVNNNYTGKKFADVICTEDKAGYLVMMPSNQISLWAKLTGEIRTAGRNSFVVWTPAALHKFLSDMGGVFRDGVVHIPVDKMEPRKERGGAGKVSGYKINPLFFVRVENCIGNGDIVSFDLKDVKQLKPTIAAKMDFKELEYNKIKDYYFRALARQRY